MVKEKFAKQVAREERRYLWQILWVLGVATATALLFVMLDLASRFLPWEMYPRIVMSVSPAQAGILLGFLLAVALGLQSAIRTTGNPRDPKWLARQLTMRKVATVVLVLITLTGAAGTMGAEIGPHELDLIGDLGPLLLTLIASFVAADAAIVSHPKVERAISNQRRKQRRRRLREHRLVTTTEPLSARRAGMQVVVAVLLIPGVLVLPGMLVARGENAIRATTALLVVEGLVVFYCLFAWEARRSSFAGNKWFGAFLVATGTVVALVTLATGVTSAIVARIPLSAAVYLGACLTLPAILAWVLAGSVGRTRGVLLHWSIVSAQRSLHLTMPGRSSAPAAEVIDVDDDGESVGLS